MSEEPRLSAVVQGLERSWAAIQGRHPDLPAVAVVISPSPRRGVCPARGDRRGGVYEVALAAEELRRPAREVFGALLHAAAHGLGDAREIQTTSRGGRYHGKRFAVLAEELGLEVAELAGFGWVETSVPDAAARTYSRQISALERALEKLPVDVPAERPKRPNTNLVPAQCSCGRKIRVARSTLAAGEITCGLCGKGFSAAEE